MNELNLNPGEYGGTYKIIGGELCLDFANTISWRNRNIPHDWFDNINNIAIWTNIIGVLGEREVLKFKKELSAKKQGAEKILVLKNLRDIIYKIFAKVAKGRSPLKADILQFNNMSKTKMSNLIVVNNAGKFNLERQNNFSPFQKVFDEIIWSTMKILTERDLSRIKQCSSCQWLYEDQSKNRSRRWCVMEDCGNRDKVNRFNKRKLKKTK